MLTVRTEDARLALEAYASANGFDLDALTAPALVDLMTGWYLAEQADDVGPEIEDDMLLVQWGEDDLEPTGATFELDITRQLTVRPDGEDDDLWQLSVTLHFAPTEDSRQVTPGNRWCEGADRVDDLRRFVESTPAWAFARSAAPLRTEVSFSTV